MESLLLTPAGGLCLRGGWPEEKRTAALPAGGYRACREQKLPELRIKQQNRGRKPDFCIVHLTLKVVFINMH